MTKITENQSALLKAARDVQPLVHRDGSVSENVGFVVSGHRFRTALSLEKRGFGYLVQMGPSMGIYREYRGGN